MKIDMISARLGSARRQALSSPGGWRHGRRSRSPRLTSIGLAVAVIGAGLVSSVVEAPVVSAAALTPSTYTAAVLADSPLGYWRMDEATASGADSSPSGFNGIIDPAVTTVGGGPFAVDQRVYSFPASGHCGINLNAYAAALKVDTLSIEAWVLSESPLLGQIYRARTEGVELDATNGSAIFGGYYNGGSDSVTKPLPTGVWHHLVGVHSATSWSLYIDGALAGSTPSNGPIYYGGNQVSIGTDPACGAAPFIGKMSNVAFYASALSASRVAAHYSAAPAVRPFGSTHGFSAPTQRMAGDPVDTATGNFYNGFTDLSGTAGLEGLTVERSYNSGDPTVGVMGAGWSAPYGSRVTDTAAYADVVMADGRVVRVPRNAAGTGFVRPDELLGELSRDPDTSLRLKFNGGEVWEFDVAGRLEKTTSASGVVATVTRDGTGKVTSVVSSAGPSLTFGYAGGLLTSVTASDGRSVSYGYTAGRLTSFTDAAGKVSTYTYDANGFLATVTDPTGVVTVSSTYDIGGRVVAQTSPNGGAETFAYDDVTRTMTHTVVATGEQIKYVHDANRRLIQVIDPNNKTSGSQVGALGFWDQQTTRTGVVTGTTRDARGNVTGATDPASGASSATYDASDRPLTMTDVASGTTTYSYAGSGTSEIPSSVTDSLGKVTTRTITNGLVMTETDPDGVVTTNTYTPQRQLLTTSVGGASTAFEYWPAGWLKKVTSPEGRVTSYTYDGEGRPLTVTAPDGGVTTTVYDNAGRVLTVTDPTLAVTTYTYDLQGRPATVAKPGKPAATFGYNALGELTTVTDPTGAVTETHYGVLGRVDWTKDTAGRQTSYTYRDDGQLWKTTAPDGGVTENTYDAAGRLATVIDPMGRVTTTTYNAGGQVWKVTAPDGGITTTEYDLVGRVKKVTDPTGRISQTTYTNAGRTKTTVDPAGVTTTLTYDTSGRLWKAADPLGNTAVSEYWPDGMVKKQTSPAGVATNYTYWPSGKVNVVSGPPAVAGVPAVSTTSVWSLRGELVSEQTSGRGARTFSYNPDGTQAWSKDERGNQTTYTYDGAGRVTGRTTPVAGGVESWGYTAGEMVSYTAPPTTVGGPGRVSLFGRDSAGRVKTVADPSGRTMTDSFNLAGDLTGRVFAQGASSFGFMYGYDTAGRQNSVVAPDGTYTKTFDLAGRVTAVTPADQRTQQFQFDAGGRVSQVTTPEGLELVYAYDTAGRVSKISPNSTMADWFTGSNGSAPDPGKWSTQTAAGGTATLGSNRLSLATTATAGSSAGVTSTAAQTADSQTTVSFKATSATVANQSKITVGVRQNAGNTQGYRVEFTSDSTTAKLVKKVGGVDTVLGTFTAPAAGAEIRTQIEVLGTTVRAKAWLASAAAPAGWGVSVVDTAIATAGVTQVKTDRVAGVNTVSVDGFRQRNNQTTGLAALVTNTYNADSQVTTEAFPSSQSRVNTFTAGRLTKQVQTVAGGNRTTDVTYDSSGAIATTAVGGVTTTYGYDPSGELLTSTPSSGSALTFTYDGAGRRTTSKVGAAAPTNYTYNTASQLTGVTPPAGSPTAFTYDSAGRRVTETTGTALTTNTFDQAGRLAGVARTSAGAVVNTEARAFTPDGLVRSDTVTGVGGALLRSMFFDWNTQTGGVAQLVSMADGAGNTGLVRNNGGWVASTVGGKPTVVAADVFGSTLNSTGQGVANATGFDPYGNPTGATATTAAKFGYRGELTIQGSTLLRAREYQATTGVFTTTDPLSDVAGTPTSGNPYHYSYNDPINRADPSGMRPGEPDGGIGWFGIRRPPVPRIPLYLELSTTPVHDSNGMFGLCGGAGATVAETIGIAVEASACLFDDSSKVFSASYAGYGLGMGKAAGVDGGFAWTNAQSADDLAGDGRCVGGSAGVPAGPVSVGLAGSYCWGVKPSGGQAPLMFRSPSPRRSQGGSHDLPLDPGLDAEPTGIYVAYLGVAVGVGSAEGHVTRGTTYINEHYHHKRLGPRATWLTVLAEMAKDAAGDVVDWLKDIAPGVVALI